jgi:hypothetical protein
MGKSKHTPGPWKAQPREFPEGQWFLEGQWEVVSTCENERLIAEAAPHIDSDSEEANARLIAAAPELLEALVWMVENDETYEGDEPIREHNGRTWNEVNAYWIEGLNRARAAIAKAEGDEQ